MILQYGSCRGQTGHLTLPNPEGWQGEGGNPLSPQRGALPGACGGAGTHGCRTDLLAPWLQAAGSRGLAGAAQPRSVFLLRCHVLKLADVQQNSNRRGKEELPNSSNSRDSCHALCETNKTTRIDLLHK